MEQFLIAGGKGRLGVAGPGFNHVVWAPGSHVDADDAAECIEALHDLSAGRALPLLVEISDVTMSAGARNALERARAVSAVALLGSTVVDNVAGAALARHDFCPHAYFTSRAAALEWLGGFVGAGEHHVRGGTVTHSPPVRFSPKVSPPAS